MVCNPNLLVRWATLPIICKPLQFGGPCLLVGLQEIIGNFNSLIANYSMIANYMVSFRWPMQLVLRYEIAEVLRYLFEQ